MEHIVQFVIGIDDEAIVKRINEKAEKTIINDLKKEIDEVIFNRAWGSKGLTYVAQDIIEGWLNDHKDEIIKSATAELTRKMMNTKAVKTAIAEAVEGVKND